MDAGAAAPCCDGPVGAEGLSLAFSLTLVSLPSDESRTMLEVSSDDRPVRPVHTPRMAPVSSGKSPQMALGGATFVRAPPHLSLVQGSAKTCLNLGRFYVRS